eukprot:475836-Pelagomonas_calceolata.AAC.3
MHLNKLKDAHAHQHKPPAKAKRSPRHPATPPSQQGMCCWAQGGDKGEHAAPLWAASVAVAAWPAWGAALAPALVNFEAWDFEASAAAAAAAAAVEQRFQVQAWPVRRSAAAPGGLCAVYGFAAVGSASHSEWKEAGKSERKECSVSYRMLMQRFAPAV